MINVRHQQSLFYGPNIEVLRLDILDDRKVVEAHSAVSDATP
jgi:hypothetical protein